MNIDWFEYLPSPQGELWQGEILANVHEHVVDAAAQDLGGVSPKVNSVVHPLSMVMTSACDLFSDHLADRSDARVNASSLQMVLLCDLFPQANIRTTERGIGSKEWPKVKGNQLIRYHCVPRPFATERTEESLLFLDFRKTFAVPPTAIYEAISSKSIERRGMLPDVYRENLLQRFYFFLGRVSLPDRA